MLFVAAVALSLSACLGDGPEKQPIRLDHSVFTDSGQTPLLPAPVLDTASIPGQTCEEVIPILGTARPGTSVFSNGGAGSAIGSAAPSTGRFCLEVHLNPNQANTIEVRSQDGSDVSPPATITVQQIYQANCGSSGPVDAGVGTKEPENIGLWAPVEAVTMPESGKEEMLTDGSDQTVAEWKGSNYCFGWDGWVKLTLPRAAEITKVVVRWRDATSSENKYYGQKYRLLFSDVSQPPQPSLNDGAWRQIKSVVGGNGGEDEFLFDAGAEPSARHVALWLEEDGEDWTCDEQFAIAEIEVWALPANAGGPPGPTPSVCTGKL